MSDTAATPGVAVRNFNDAGTGASFTAGETYDLEPGVYANYAAADLVVAPAPETAPSAETDA